MATNRINRACPAFYQDDGGRVLDRTGAWQACIDTKGESMQAR